LSKIEKMLLKILSGNSDSNISFDELIGILQHLGLNYRVKGSHYIFGKVGTDLLINLQRDGKMAKVYQVQQVRKKLTEYQLFNGYLDV